MAPALRDHAVIRRAVEQTAAARSAAGICITNVGVVAPALGPHTARVTGYRTVVNRVGANYGSSSISAPSAGRSRRHWPSAPQHRPGHGARRGEGTARPRAAPAAARRGLPAGAS
ncbi:hypothetical protein O1M63_53030 [Streptomyces mirabilis]|nr:hypothetical protein [Streptomyces mirabilis]